MYSCSNSYFNYRYCREREINQTSNVALASATITMLISSYMIISLKSQMDGKHNVYRNSSIAKLNKMLIHC